MKFVPCIPRGYHTIVEKEENVVQVRGRRLMRRTRFVFMYARAIRRNKSSSCRTSPITIENRIIESESKNLHNPQPLQIDGHAGRDTTNATATTASRPPYQRGGILAAVLDGSCAAVAAAALHHGSVAFCLLQCSVPESREECAQ